MSLREDLARNVSAYCRMSGEGALCEEGHYPDEGEMESKWREERTGKSGRREPLHAPASGSADVGEAKWDNRPAYKKWNPPLARVGQPGEVPKVSLTGAWSEDTAPAFVTNAADTQEGPAEILPGREEGEPGEKAVLDALFRRLDRESRLLPQDLKPRG